MTLKTLLLAALALVVIGFVLAWYRHLKAPAPAGQADLQPAPPSALMTMVGFVTNFFDTLGIGSYAPTTAVFKLKGLVPDEHIPGTLTIGHTLATVTQAFIFITLVQVEPMTLTLMIGAAVAGAWIGAGVVAGWPRRNVQIGMGLALLVAATLFIRANLVTAAADGTAIGLHGAALGAGLVGNFALGALMTIGIGLYGPCMILIGLLGMDPKVAFPIMMGSCAFLMPISAIKFLRAGSYSVRPAFGLALGGVPAVLLAAFVVKSLDVRTVRWLVVVVVLYSAAMMLRSAWMERPRAAR